MSENDIENDTRIGTVPTVQGLSTAQGSSTTLTANNSYLGDKWNWLLILTTINASFGYGVPVGFNLGVLNTPEKLLKQWWNETLIEEHDKMLTEEELNSLWSMVVSVYLICGMIGGLLGSSFADSVGRKGSMIIGNAFNTIACSSFLISQHASSVELFFLGRVFTGLAAGLLTTVVPMYLTEISPPKLRGVMGVIFPIGLTFGILFSQLLGLYWVLNDISDWATLLSSFGIFTTISFLILPTQCESPKYLYRQGKREEALAELSYLRQLPNEVVSWELTQGHSVGIERTYVEWNLRRVLSTRRLLIPLFLVVSLQAGQQFSGINTVFYYSSTMFEKAGVSKKIIPYVNVGTGFINFAANYCSIYLVHRCGRRFLLISSGVSTAIALILLSFSVKFMDVTDWMPYLSVLFVFAFVLVYNLGLGPIPYFIGAELVDIGPRPTIMALGSIANWGANFIIGISYKSMYSHFHENLFLVFAVITLGLSGFILALLPETRESPSLVSIGSSVVAATINKTASSEILGSVENENQHENIE